MGKNLIGSGLPKFQPNFVCLVLKTYHFLCIDIRNYNIRYKIANEKESFRIYPLFKDKQESYYSPSHAQHHLTSHDISPLIT